MYDSEFLKTAIDTLVEIAQPGSGTTISVDDRLRAAENLLGYAQSVARLDDNAAAARNEVRLLVEDWFNQYAGGDEIDIDGFFAFLSKTWAQRGWAL